MVLAPSLYNSFATAVDPVKVIFLTILFSQSSAATSRTLSRVVTTLRTPSGMPARLASSTRARQLKGVSGGGLITTVQPAASAGPTFRVIMADGKFHGVRAPLYRAIRLRKEKTICKDVWLRTQHLLKSFVLEFICLVNVSTYRLVV